jgi:enterochelin esterase-like enzyme
MRSTIAVFIVLVFALPARAQYLACVDLDRVNRQLAGPVDNYTRNHGSDHRIFSPILGKPRDLYVYVPPGYDPRRAYPLLLYFHMAFVDEHYFVGSRLLTDLDSLILRGAFPEAIVACPDGTYGGRDLIPGETHSFFINGLGGRFEDHVFQEVIPFLAAHYSIRPEHEAHALVGTSAGGYGAKSLAIRHRDTIGAVATLAGPLNLRYSNVDETTSKASTRRSTDGRPPTTRTRLSRSTIVVWSESKPGDTSPRSSAWEMKPLLGSSPPTRPT